jgi:hypothetical protein
MSSVPAYNAYAQQVLVQEMDPTAIAGINAFSSVSETEPEVDGALHRSALRPHALRIPVWTALIRCSAWSPSSTRRSTFRCGPSELGPKRRREACHWHLTDELASIKAACVRLAVVDAAHGGGQRPSRAAPVQLERTAVPHGASSSITPGVTF